MCRVGNSFFPTLLLGIAILALAPTNAFAADGGAPPRDSCPRPVAGSTVHPPPDLFSRDGVLNVVLTTSRRSMMRGARCFASGPRTVWYRRRCT
jgi:hypothetical protein